MTHFIELKTKNKTTRINLDNVFAVEVYASSNSIIFVGKDGQFLYIPGSFEPNLSESDIKRILNMIPMENVIWYGDKE
jgi:hypothetical protein